MDESRVEPARTKHSTMSDWITAMSTLTLALLALAALAVACFQIHEMREEAKVQHLTEFVNKFDSPDWVSDRKSLATKRVDQQAKRLRQLDINDSPIELDDELGFCEDLGLLTRRGYLDRHDVWSEFGDWLFYLSTDARPLLDAGRKDDPSYYLDCTDLVESLKRIETEEAGGANDHPSETDLYNRYMGDIERAAGQPANIGPRRKKR